MLDDYRNKILSGESFSVVIPLLLDMSLPEPTQKSYDTKPCAILCENPVINRSTPELSALSQSEFLSEYLKENPLIIFHVLLSIFIWKKHQPRDH